MWLCWGYYLKACFTFKCSEANHWSNFKVLTKVRNELKRPKTILNELKLSTRAYIIKTTSSYNRDRTQSKWFLSQQSRNFHCHVFSAIFFLMWHSSVFQIITWNWKHLINRKVQGKKVFWHVILHSYLCNALCKFFIKIESN